MVFDVLSSLVNIIQMNSYFFIFLLMIVDGPIITAVSSYAASIGYFNVWIIFLISIFGNFLPDVSLYLIGRFSRTKRTEFFIKKFGLKDYQIENIENNLKKHSGKTLCIIKLCPFLPIPGLLLAGFSKIQFKKFLFRDIFLNIIVSAIMVLFGYYFGFMINTIFKYFKIGQYSIIGAIPVVIIVYFIYRKIKNNEKRLLIK